MKGIIILEGGDSSGKTTLAEAFKKKYPNSHYLHGVPFADCFTEHLKMLKEAIRLSRQKLVIVDRHWISEQVYGPVVRGRSQYDLAGRCFDRMWRTHAAVYVMCVPKDMLKQHARWKSDRVTGRPEYCTAEQALKVMSRYHALMHKSGCAPDEEIYVNLLTCNGQFSSRDGVHLYDMHVDDTERAVDDVSRAVFQRRQRQITPVLDGRMPNFVGYRPTLATLFVGEELSPRAPAPWPFFWDDSNSAATYLNKAIQHLHLNEASLGFTNAKAAASSGSLSAVLSQLPRGLKIIALGRKAEKALNTIGREHSHIEHPQWVRRFIGGNSVWYADKLSKVL